MKRIFFAIMLLAATVGRAQLVMSAVNIESEINGIFRNDRGQKAEIELNPQSQDLVVNITLSPSVLGLDSVSYSMPICAYLRAKFPYNNLDFYEDSYENKNYSMNALLTLNGVGKQFTLPFTLVKPLPGRLDNGTSMSYYPVFISLNFSINPADFGLGQASDLMKRKVLISIPEGVINKNNDAVNTARCRNPQ